MGVAATVEHRRALAGLDIATVVDIGANKGQFSLYCLDAFPGVRIIGFEPLAEPARRFRAVFDAVPDVRLFEVAIGAASGTATINVAGRMDSSSLLPITPLQTEVFPGTGCQETRAISVARLEDVITTDDLGHPALLKLDVQGFELDALRGCESLLSQFAYVYVECSFVELYAGQALADDVAEFLRSRGFRMGGVFNQVMSTELGAIQADFLFVSGRQMA